MPLKSRGTCHKVALLASVSYIPTKLLFHHHAHLVLAVPSWHIWGMNNGEEHPSGGSGKGHAAKRAREERSARALRDNLRRRKMQVRERTEDGNCEKHAVNDSPDPASDQGGDPGKDQA